MTTAAVFQGKPVRVDGNWGVEIRLAQGDAEPRPGDTVETLPRQGQAFDQVIARVVRRNGHVFTCAVAQNRQAQQSKRNRQARGRHCQTCTCATTGSESLK